MVTRGRGRTSETRRSAHRRRTCCLEVSPVVSAECRGKGGAPAQARRRVATRTVAPGESGGAQPVASSAHLRAQPLLALNRPVWEWPLYDMGRISNVPVRESPLKWLSVRVTTCSPSLALWCGADSVMKPVSELHTTRVA